MAAIALTTTVVVMIGGGLLTILHLSANQLSDIANAGPPRDVYSAASATTQESCAEQSWPFMEGRCLLDTNSLRKTERAMLRQGEFALVPRKRRARAKSSHGTAVVSTRSRATQTTASTTGAAPRQPEKATSVANAAQSEPPSVATASAASPTRPKIDNAIASRRAQDQRRREARRKERLTREQREARAEMRARRDEQSSANRRNGNPYSSSYGYSAGWQRGPFDGGFFSTIR